MPKRNRVAIALLVILGLASASWFWLSPHTSPEPIPTDSEASLSVACRHSGGHNPDDEWWSLTLDAQGSGVFEKSKRPPTRVSLPKVIPELSKALGTPRLSELRPRGLVALDHSINTLGIVTMNLDETITIGFVTPADDNDRRAQELWTVIERCAQDVLKDKTDSARAAK